MTLRYAPPFLAPMAAVLLIAACGSDASRFIAPEPAPAAERVGIAYESVELREVSLPTYAVNQEIVVASPSGEMEDNSDFLWADDPRRAVTLGLAQSLTALTNARVAPEPWPFVSRPQVSVDVRFDSFLPDTLGRFTAKGLYFVAPDAEDRPERARPFHIVQTFAPEGGYQAIAAARSAVVAELAVQIAREGLR